MWRDESLVILMKSEDFMIEVKLWDEKLNCYWCLFAIYVNTDEKMQRDQ